MDDFPNNIVRNPRMKPSEVVGLEAMNDIIEGAISPNKFPRLFSGPRKPWRAVLLFGPPGTGKTYLAETVATEAEVSKFLCISPSDLSPNQDVESASLVRGLFQYARDNTPSIIFFDEVDSLLSERFESEYESSTKMKSEFLIRMDGARYDNDGILVIGATNIPWVLDGAILRRFEKSCTLLFPKRKID